VKPIIEVHNLSKKYKIGATQPRYLSLRDSLSQTFKGVKNWVNFDKLSRLKRADETDFWALKDINFEVHAGESIGIIGRNGAGKSTLLKILSRITPPTSGRAILRGRLASLLEVGTGFHPELTGRENVYFNGSILGLRKSEIDRQFDEIVDFSGVERFIDTPLKNYSSGMQLRLAFAVAAHLEPEILIIDEVLAVGDAEFQKKCLGKMNEVSKSGRTVIFVSHNLPALQSLCSKSILLDEGQITAIDETHRIINKYLEKKDVNELCEWKPSDRMNFKNDYFTPLYFAIINQKLETVSSSVQNNSTIGFLIEGYINILNTALTIGIAIYTVQGDLLFRSFQTDKLPDYTIKFEKGLNKIIAWLPPHFLNEGDYFVELIGGVHNQFWICEPQKNIPILKLHIKDGLSNSPYWVLPRPGILAPHIKFELVEK
jgi:lipopolysaccharide transport system ATP-binding protein